MLALSSAVTSLLLQSKIRFVKISNNKWLFQPKNKDVELNVIYVSYASCVTQPPSLVIMDFSIENAFSVLSSLLYIISAITT